MTKMGKEFDPCSALPVSLSVKPGKNLECPERPGNVRLNEVDGEGG